jgi:hypothetical protein
MIGVPVTVETFRPTLPGSTIIWGPLTFGSNVAGAVAHPANRKARRTQNTPPFRYPIFDNHFIFPFIV